MKDNIKYSAGIIPYRISEGHYEFFVGHPGGPYWADKNYWALLKGRLEYGEDEKTAALREFQEESGIRLPEDAVYNMWKVCTLKQNPKKMVTAFAVEYGDIDPSQCHSNMADYCDWPEIDSYAWVPYEEILKCTHKNNTEFYKKIVETKKMQEQTNAING